jgi:hypothetical protein
MPPKRFEVTVKRRFIAYAETPEIAVRRVLKMEGQECELLEVKELPKLKDEPQTPVIDVTPVLQRKVGKIDGT